MHVPSDMIILAYVDPGVGSYIVQMLAAGILGAAYAFRRWIKSFILTVFRRNDTETGSRDE